MYPETKKKAQKSTFGGGVTVAKQGLRKQKLTHKIGGHPGNLAARRAGPGPNFHRLQGKKKKRYAGYPLRREEGNRGGKTRAPLGGKEDQQVRGFTLPGQPDRHHSTKKQRVEVGWENSVLVREDQ